MSRLASTTANALNVVLVASLQLAILRTPHATAGGVVTSPSLPTTLRSLPASVNPGRKDVAAEIQEALNLALVLEARGAYRQAAQIWESLVSLFETALGADHRSTAQARANLGKLYVKLSRYGEAETLLKSTLSVFEKQMGAEHPDTAVSLNNLGFLFEEQGRYPEAESFYRRALSIRSGLLGVQHLSTATSIDNLASLYVRQGRFTEAEGQLRQALAIRERAKGADSREVAISYNNLAVLYETLGRHAEAELLYRQALEIRREMLGEEHPETITSASNLASLYESLGRYVESESLYRDVLSRRERVLDADHPTIAISLSNLASVLKRLGRAAEAEKLYARAQIIQVRTLGTQHDTLAVTLSNRAGALQDLGRLKEAEALYQQALAIRRKVLSKEHPNMAITLNNLATNQFLQGRDIIALDLYRKGLEIGEVALGSEHPGNAQRLDNLAMLLLLLGRFETSSALLERLNQTQIQWLQRELPRQPRELRLALIANQPDAVASTFSLLDQYPAAARMALELRLNRQGLLAEIERRQWFLTRSSPQTQVLAERLAGIDQQLASSLLSPERRKALQQEQQRQESQLYRALPVLRIEPVTTDQVAASLMAMAPQGVLLEFQKYRPYRRLVRGDAQWGPPRYVALLLRPDGSIRSIPLGEAAPIDKAVQEAVAASANANRQEEASRRLAQLSQLILAPLSNDLAGVRELFISPDGELNRVPFAALPVGLSDGQTFGESLHLRILTTGRDLLRLQRKASKSGPAVLIFDPDYNAIITPAASSTKRATRIYESYAWFNYVPKAAEPGSLERLPPWSPLSGTVAEGRLLVEVLNPGVVISKEEATAELVLQQKAPSILHIATHGFFLQDQPTSGRKGEQRAVDPLKRSGLVFAGANSRNANLADDGYLTAAEATTMDLDGTELVTLSACETGLGEELSGEGVYGLQRALTVAGARSTLLSLWKVDDELTALFMQQFYRRLKDGQSRAEALRFTQAAFRNHKNSSYNDVRIWAAFQLSGDWRSIPAW